MTGAGLGVAVLLVVTAGAGWAVYVKLEGNITADEAAAAELARFERERPTALAEEARNILLIGSDSRSGNENGRYGRDPGTERSDTVILLHLPAGRSSATAVSLPRDLMVDVPGCLRRDGTRAEPVFTMFNQAFQRGGSACAIRTVEKLTGIRVDHHIVVDFHGFKEMVEAVDGRLPPADLTPGRPARPRPRTSETPPPGTVTRRSPTPTSRNPPANQPETLTEIRPVDPGSVGFCGHGGDAAELPSATAHAIGITFQ